MKWSFSQFKSEIRDIQKKVKIFRWPAENEYQEKYIVKRRVVAEEDIFKMQSL